MRRGWLAVVAALATACGGGSSPAAAPVAAPAPSAAPVVLDAGSFGARVAAGVALVEFHSPT